MSRLVSQHLQEHVHLLYTLAGGAHTPEPRERNAAALRTLWGWWGNGDTPNPDTTAHLVAAQTLDALLDPLEPDSVTFLDHFRALCEACDVQVAWATNGVVVY